MTSVRRTWGGWRIVFRLEGSINIGRPGLCRSRRAGLSALKIIAHDTAQNEPGRSHCSLHRAADFGFSNARVVAHRNFNNAESRKGALQDHFNRPAVGVLLERKSMQDICTRRAERSEVTDFHGKQKSDKTCC